MTNDELRALAGKLRKLQAGEAYEAADYLLACADAKPVAVPAGWRLVPVEPTPEMLDEGCDVDARAEVIKKYAAMPVIRNPENYCSCGEMLAVQYRAMLAAAPAAPQAMEDANVWKQIVPDDEPQAEPIDPHMIVAEDRFPDEQAEPPSEEVIEGVEDYLTDFREQIHAVTDLTQWATAIAGYVLLVHGRQSTEPQAEPKRAPLSDSDADYWLRNRQAILDAIRREGFVLMSNACGFWLKRMDKVSEAHGIGGSDAE